jgi:arylsulfatase A-like enzyme
VPFVVKWTDHLPAGRVDRRPIIQLDVAPTALAAAGVAEDTSAAFDGVNLLPYLRGTAKGSPHDTLYWRLGGMMAIRQGDWKLVKTRAGAFVDADPAVLSDLSGAELYDLAKDLGETKNLAASRHDKVKELGDAWQQWNRQLDRRGATGRTRAVRPALKADRPACGCHENKARSAPAKPCRTARVFPRGR